MRAITREYALKAIELRMENLKYSIEDKKKKMMDCEVALAEVGITEKSCGGSFIGNTEHDNNYFMMVWKEIAMSRKKLRREYDCNKAAYEDIKRQ